MNHLQLVTGGSGYFGSLLVRLLRERGLPVRIFDLNDADDRPADVELVRGDIRNADAIRRACEGCEVVHHNVAMVPLAKDREAFWSVNVDGTGHLLRASAAAGVRKVIHTSSSAVFGVPPKNPIDDTVAPRPQEAYGKAKLAAEHLCAEYIAKGLDVTLIRPRTIMGHGRLGIMQILFEWIHEGKNVPVLGGGHNVYQFVHADDLADACIRAAARTGPAVYNVGTAQFGTMRETLNGLIEHAGTGSHVVSVPMGPAVWGMKLTSALGLSPLGAYHSLMYGRSMYFDITRTCAELGWTPKYGNVEMFCESYDWYLANREKTLATTGASHHRSRVKQGVLSLVGKVLQAF
jgi:nucleoside-diphosphate-sugar epimerase